MHRYVMKKFNMDLFLFLKSMISVSTAVMCHFSAIVLHHCSRDYGAGIMVLLEG